MEFFDLEFAVEISPLLLRAMGVTIRATFFGFAIAAVLGLLLAIGRRADAKWIAWPASAIVEFVRSTPLLVQLFLLFYVLPRYGLRLPAFTLGVIGLGLHYGAYTSEVYRAGIDAVERGQWEAATALNFSIVQKWTRIVLPQAIPPMIPALGNYLIAMFKETPLLSAITVVEMFQRAKIISSQTFQPLEPYTMVGLLFFLLSYPSVLILQRLESRFVRSS
ncbi:MAG: ectoine/hydroxyectoine ABC transporter permease subunit EhuD [Chloroflexota bacterium]|nr:ectoine/hydroxyectoine ABC transporter permease subunit EhuD [Chloroflexota bacterium]